MDSCEALQRKLNALLREPGEARHYNETGVWLFRLKDFENSLKYLEKACALCPDDTDILYNYASVLYMLAHWARCADALESLLKQEPENKKAWGYLAHACYCMGQYARAEACVKNAQTAEGTVWKTN